MDNPFERALNSFPTDQIDLVEEKKAPDPITVKSHELATAGRQEVMNLFGTTRELMGFAGENLSELAWSRYSDLNNEHPDNPYAKDLPPKFYSAVSDYPGMYYIVGYENRINNHYQPGTRFRSVKLSTARKWSENNDKIREIEISEFDPSEGKGNVQFLAVKDYVNNKGVSQINTAGIDQVDSPHGSAKLTYEVDANGTKKLHESEFNRLDEGFFEWKGATTPVRWIRNLYIEKQGTDETQIEYKDEYIIGRHHQNTERKDDRVSVKIIANGNLDNPKQVRVLIGQDIGGNGEVIYEDESSGIKVEFHDNSWTSKDEIIEILSQDPNYSFLFGKDIDKNKVIQLLSGKASMITNDWDKPTVVFGAPALEEGNERLSE